MWDEAQSEYNASVRIARNLLSDGFPLEIVAKNTGLLSAMSRGLPGDKRH